MAFRTHLATAIVALACTGVAKANTLHLSSHSSDETPASQLLAEFAYSVSGTFLTIVVENQTVVPFEFNIEEMYFNVPDGVTLTVNTMPANWGIATSAMVDGFGVFDYGMVDGSPTPNRITPGNSLTFIFNIIGGTPTKGDFVTSESTLGFFAAAKFVQGTDRDDSAFGAIIPLPPALPMGIAGLIGVAFLRRRRGKK